MILLCCLFYSLYIELPTSVSQFSLQMICDFPEWWALPTYSGFKSNVNVNEGPEYFAGDRIKVEEEEA